MARPRKLNRDLPPCVYHNHGAYYYIKAGKWTRLGADLAGALLIHARLFGEATGSMPALIYLRGREVPLVESPSFRRQLGSAENE